MKIENARVEQSVYIATLIMEAMNHDCCQYFAGSNHTLDDFHQVLTRLIERTDSQYSYLNTLVAVNDDEEVVGMCVAYDGACLRELRRPFIEACKQEFAQDFSDMADETSAGEFYIDSIAVCKEHRGKGIAKILLQATIDKAQKQGHERVGLLVDKANPKAEQLYQAVGFVYEGDNIWGGHPMKHLVYNHKRL